MEKERGMLGEQRKRAGRDKGVRKRRQFKSLKSTEFGTLTVEQDQ